MDFTSIVKQPVEIDLTPLVDCVFLLMIFFVLVIDLSQKNLEDLVLPQAVFQQPDNQPPPDRPVLNVLQNGTVVYNQFVAHDPAVDGKDYRRVKDLLVGIRQAGLAAQKLHLTEEAIGGHAVMADPILIRADKWTEWHHIAEVMKLCSLPEIAFKRVELAMSAVDKEKADREPAQGTKRSGR